MSATMTLADNASWIEREQDLLPIMTAIFVDGLENGPCGSEESTTMDRICPSGDGVARIFRLPLSLGNAVPLQKRREADEASGDHDAWNFRTPFGLTNGEQAVVRSLIRGISHHFNNLLMGIWGNASLIRLQLRSDDERYARVEQMERLIQSGAFLIHMVLGFLSERRTVAKRIRLNQLISEMKCDGCTSLGEGDPWNFTARLKWASRVQRPRLIAGSTGRVLEVLFQSIGKHCRAILSPEEDDARFQKRLSTINILVDRGLDMVGQLLLYAGDCGAVRKKMLKPNALLDRLLSRVRHRYPQIETHCRIGVNLPRIKANRRQLEWALDEIVANAARAMPDGGHLHISVQTLQEEAPRDRCGVQKGSNYLVITVHDCGCGIGEASRKRVFQPFFSDPKIQGHVGLGLAAADGILKSHSGYIHLQSETGTGTTFKLYLPFEGAALLDQQLKERRGALAVIG